MDVRAELAATALFGAASAAELDVLTALAGRRTLSRGQGLFAEGDASDHLYVVVSGRLKVQLTSVRGDELLLAVVGPGEGLGELSVLDGLPRSAGAVALEPTVLLALPAAGVQDLLARSPGLALAWAQEVAATVRRLTGSTGDLVLLDLPRRLAKHLLEAARGDAVELGLSQGEVASRLGVARQSLNRALMALQQRGWVRVDGPRVVLRDRPALERFAAS